MTTPSIREMKDAMTARSVSFADYTEKAELVARYQSAMSRPVPPKATASARAPAPRATASGVPPRAAAQKKDPPPPKQLTVAEMGKNADGSDGGPIGTEIRRICSCKDFYEILKVERSCNEDHLKK